MEIKGLFILALCFLSVVTQNTITNCASYTPSGSLCNICNAGYLVSTDKTICNANDCSAIQFCSLCDGGTTNKCLTCMFGYEASGDKLTCTKIVCNDVNCNSCSSNAVNSCYSCNIGYYVTANYTCL